MQIKPPWPPSAEKQTVADRILQETCPHFDLQFVGLYEALCLLLGQSIGTLCDLNLFSAGKLQEAQSVMSPSRCRGS